MDDARTLAVLAQFRAWLTGPTPVPADAPHTYLAELGWTTAQLDQALPDHDPVAPSLLVTNPLLAEAMIAAARGVPWQREPSGTSGNYWVYDRRGPTPDAEPIALFKNAAEDYAPDAAVQAAARADADQHPLAANLVKLISDPARRRTVLAQAAAEQRFFYLGSPLGSGPDKEIVAAALGRELGVPATVAARLHGHDGCLQAYLPRLQTLEQRTDLWHTAPALKAHQAELQQIAAFYGIIGQEDTWEIYVAGDAAQPRLIPLDHNKCLTDLLCRWGFSTFSLMISGHRPLRYAVGRQLTLPVTDAVHVWWRDLHFAERLDRAAAGRKLSAEAVQEAQLTARLWSACLAHDLSVWDFLLLRCEPLTAWFNQNGPEGDPAALAADLAARYADLPKPRHGPLDAAFRDAFQAALDQIRREQPVDAPHDWFIEDLGMVPIQCQAGFLDAGLFPDHRIHCDSEPDASWRAAACTGLRRLTAYCFGADGAEAAFMTLTHLLAEQWLAALAETRRQGHDLRFADGTAVLLEAETDQPDIVAVTLNPAADGLHLSLSFTRAVAALTDRDEQRRIATQPRVSWYHLELALCLSQDTHGRTNCRLVRAPDCSFGYALPEIRDCLFLW